MAVSLSSQTRVHLHGNNLVHQPRRVIAHRSTPYHRLWSLKLDATAFVYQVHSHDPIPTWYTKAVASSFNTQRLPRSFQGIGTTICQAVTTCHLMDPPPSEPPGDTVQYTAQLPSKLPPPNQPSAPFRWVCTERRAIRVAAAGANQTRARKNFVYARSGHWKFGVWA